MVTAQDSGPDVHRPRAILLIANSAAPYSRGLRVARSLVEAGYDVEIAATSGAGVPDQEQDGPFLIRRYRPSGRWAGWAADATGGAQRDGKAGNEIEEAQEGQYQEHAGARSLDQ